MKRRIMMAGLMAMALTAGSLTALAGSGMPGVKGKQQKTGQMTKEHQGNHQQKSESEAALAKEAKIKLEEAREIALKRAPGKVESENLERERGKLVYSFDIRTGKNITEVQVNALDGKIVRVEKETPAKEAAEKRKEEREKAKHNTKQ